MRLRSSKLVFAHSAWTARERSIAAFTSSGSHFGTVPSGLPVNGCSICIGSLPEFDFTRAASDSSCDALIRFDGISTRLVDEDVAGVSVMVDIPALSQVTLRLITVPPEE